MNANETVHLSIPIIDSVIKFHFFNTFIVLLQSLPPIIGENPKWLILGSMPGALSLSKSKYYAHPQNIFWEIMRIRFQFEADMSYDQQLEVLKKNNIALWDVLYQCKRVGSLDSKIELDSAKENAILELLTKHQSIDTILFNGKKACQFFHRSFDKNKTDFFDRYHYNTLPSTSPANASIPKDFKMAAWIDALSNKTNSAKETL